MSWKKVTDNQWEKIAEQLPIRKKSSQGGRPPADDRKCFEGVSGQVLPGVNYRVGVVQKVRSIGDCKNGQKRKRQSICGRFFSANYKRKNRFVGMNVLLMEPFVVLKKGRKSRKNQAGQGNKAYGTG